MDGTAVANASTSDTDATFPPLGLNYDPAGFTVALNSSALVPASAFFDFRTFTANIRIDSVLTSGSSPRTILTYGTVGTNHILIEQEYETDISICIQIGSIMANVTAQNVTIAVWHKLRIAIDYDGNGALFVSFDNLTLENTSTDFLNLTIPLGTVILLF